MLHSSGTARFQTLRYCRAELKQDLSGKLITVRTIDLPASYSPFCLKRNGVI